MYYTLRLYFPYLSLLASRLIYCFLPDFIRIRFWP